MGVRGIIVRLLLIISLLFQGCGDVTFFFFFNTGQIDDARRSGAILIIGTVPEEEPKEVRVVSGKIPKGMKLMSDGTIQGIPEESGLFVITVRITYQDNSVEEMLYEIEIE